MLLYTLGNLIAVRAKNTNYNVKSNREIYIFFKWIKLTITKKSTPSSIHNICIAKKGQEKLYPWNSKITPNQPKIEYIPIFFKTFYLKYRSKELCDFFYKREWIIFAFFKYFETEKSKLVHKVLQYIKPLEINCNQILPNFLFSKFRFLEFELWNIIWMIFPLCHVLWCNSKLTAVVWVNLSWSLGGVSNFCSNQTKWGEIIYENASHKGFTPTRTLNS